MDPINSSQIVHKWIILNCAHLLELDSKIAPTRPSLIYSNPFLTQNDKLNFSLRLVPLFADDEQQARYISIYFHVEQLRNAEQLALDLEISLSVNEKILHRLPLKKVKLKENDYKGVDKFMPVSELNQKIVQFRSETHSDGTLTIICKITSGITLPIGVQQTLISEFDAKFPMNIQTIEWKIDEFRHYIYSKSKFTKSDTYTLEDGICCVLILDFNSSSTELKDYVSLFVNFESSSRERKTTYYQASILDRNWVQFVTGEGRLTIRPGELMCKGSPKFIPKEALLDLDNELLLRDELKIFVKVEIHPTTKKNDPKRVVTIRENTSLDNLEWILTINTVNRIVNSPEFDQQVNARKWENFAAILSLFKKAEQQIDFLNEEQEGTMVRFLLKLAIDHINKEAYSAILTLIDDNLSRLVLSLVIEMSAKLLNEMQNGYSTLGWKCHSKLCDLIDREYWRNGKNQDPEPSKNIIGKNISKIYEDVLFMYVTMIVDCCEDDDKSWARALNALRRMPMSRIGPLFEEIVSEMTQEFNLASQSKHKAVIDCVCFQLSISRLPLLSAQQMALIKRYLVTAFLCNDEDICRKATFALENLSADNVPVAQIIVQLEANNDENIKFHKVSCCELIQFLFRETRYNLLASDTKNVMRNFIIKLLKNCADSEHTNMQIGNYFKTFNSILVYREMHNEELEYFTNYYTNLSTAALYDIRHSTFDYIRYQAGFCVQWNSENPQKNTHCEVPVIKVSSVGVTAANFDIRDQPVRCAFPLTSGVFYYEAIFLSEGEMQFGWCTRDAYSGMEFGKDSRYRSIPYGPRGFVHENCNINCKIGDVIGCLLDTVNVQYCFYYNGEMIPTKQKIAVGLLPPLFAFARLGPNQQCHFNFGQVQFKYPPKGIKVKDFHAACGEKNAKQYQLLHTFESTDYYEKDTDTEKGFNRFLAHFGSNFNWFAPSVVDNNVQPLFSDAKQKSCDNLFLNLQSNKSSLASIICNKIDNLRIVQSLIEVLPIKLEKRGELLTFITEILFKRSTLLGQSHKKTYYMLLEFRKCRICLYEMMSAYLQLTPTEENLVKCHNISTICNILRKDYRFGSTFRENLTEFNQRLSSFRVESETHKEQSKTKLQKFEKSLSEICKQLKKLQINQQISFANDYDYNLGREEFRRRF